MPEFLKTGDGSFTLYKPDLDETYHSRHGALTESNYVFIAKGLEFCLEKFGDPLNVLEVGLGTGLNALLTSRLALKNRKSIFYKSLEPYPINDFILKNLSEIEQDWKKILDTKDGYDYSLNEFFIFSWEKVPLQNFESPQKFDCVYYDAFAPQKQPDLWTIDIFIHLHQLMNLGGVMVTYCAQGAFKRNLKSAGFEVEVLPGPPGKREMTRAFKI